MTQRLVGAIVLVALAVIFVPMLFERDNAPSTGSLPPMPPPPPEAGTPIVIPLEQPKPDTAAVSPGRSAPPTSTETQAPDLTAGAVEKPQPAGQRPAAEPPASEASNAGNMPTSPPPAEHEPASKSKEDLAMLSPPGGTKVPERPTAETPPHGSELNAVPAPPAASSSHPRKNGPSAWVVQVGTFSNPDTAMELRDRLRREGHTAFIEVLKAPRGTLYRVRVGPELRREAADALRGKLRKDLHLDALVVRYP